MRLFDIIALLVVLSAILNWVNARFLKLPATIGLMILALSFSLILLLPLPGSETPEQLVRSMLAGIDFNETLLHGMLSALLFAGALHVNLRDLAEHRLTILILATFGTLLTTFLIGFGTWGLVGLIGLEVPLIYCLLFGALIAPTDPIAVLGILKSAGAPKSLETKIIGESLFNDGVAVVTFMILLQIATGAVEINALGVAELLAREVIGAVLVGLACGGLVCLMLRQVDDYPVEMLLTLAAALGSFALAEHLHVSGPITVVIAGLMIGYRGRGLMSERTRSQVDIFWTLVDEVLNTVLFVLIGLEIIVLAVTGQALLAGAILIPLVLAARAISVALPISLLRHFRKPAPGAVAVLTWGGLRGGVSVALALSLPEGELRDLLVTVTYVIVVFSVVVQGLTLAPLVRSVAAQADRELERLGAAEDSGDSEKA